MSVGALTARVGGVGGSSGGGVNSGGVFNL